MERIEAKILYEVADSKKNIWELLDRSNCSLKDFVDALKTLYKNGIIDYDGTYFYLTEKGKSSINLKSLDFKVEVCPSCLGRRIIPQMKFKEVLNEFKQITRKRPRPALKFFQGYMVEQDVITRVALMHHHGDLDGKSIVLIGDDDLLSIALSLTTLPSRITVLEIDKRIGEFLKSINKDYGFNIEFIEYDVSNPLPKELHESFDTFSSEPLETLSGLRAFIVRGVSCLKEGGAGYFGLTRYEASLGKWLAIQRLLVKMNCAITDIIEGFSTYPMDYGDLSYERFVYNLGFKVEKNHSVNWYKSALYRFEVLSKARILEGFNKRLRIKSIDSREDLTHPALYRRILEESIGKDRNITK
ncbi:MAG: bis-aminopropyl spermidine synthase family protein [Nitrososphaerales archaeon]|nr:bis-aminopropyl spermidine synthase family protein [Nitrososphaerales archaeon]